MMLGYKCAIGALVPVSSVAVKSASSPQKDIISARQAEFASYGPGNLTTLPRIHIDPETCVGTKATRVKAAVEDARMLANAGFTAVSELRESTFMAADSRGNRTLSPSAARINRMWLTIFGWSHNFIDEVWGRCSFAYRQNHLLNATENYLYAVRLTEAIVASMENRTQLMIRPSNWTRLKLPMRKRFQGKFLLANDQDSFIRCDDKDLVARPIDPNKKSVVPGVQQLYDDKRQVYIKKADGTPESPDLRCFQGQFDPKNLQMGSFPMFTVPSTGDIFLCPEFFKAAQPSIKVYKQEQSKLRVFNSAMTLISKFPSIVNGTSNFTSLDDISASRRGSMSPLLFQELFHQTGFNFDHYIHYGLFGGSKFNHKGLRERNIKRRN